MALCGDVPAAFGAAAGAGDEWDGSSVRQGGLNPVGHAGRGCGWRTGDTGEWFLKWGFARASRAMAVDQRFSFRWRGSASRACLVGQECLHRSCTGWPRIVLVVADALTSRFVVMHGMHGQKSNAYVGTDPAIIDRGLNHLQLWDHGAQIPPEG